MSIFFEFEMLRGSFYETSQGYIAVQASGNNVFEFRKLDGDKIRIGMFKNEKNPRLMIFSLTDLRFMQLDGFFNEHEDRILIRRDFGVYPHHFDGECSGPVPIRGFSGGKEIENPVQVFNSFFNVPHFDSWKSIQKIAELPDELREQIFEIMKGLACSLRTQASIDELICSMIEVYLKPEKQKGQGGPVSKRHYEKVKRIGELLGFEVYQNSRMEISRSERTCPDHGQECSKYEHGSSCNKDPRKWMKVGRAPYVFVIFEC